MSAFADQMPSAAPIPRRYSSPPMPPSSIVN
jgi:hypothetical protein